MIITRQEYPPSSAQALFVQRVLSEWAKRARRSFEQTPKASDLQRKLIDTLDLARLERQVRFLIAALSWWYKPSADDRAHGVPDRRQLDQAKHDLYRRIDELNGLALLLVENEDVRGRVDEIFGRAVLAAEGAADPLDATSRITPTSSPNCRRWCRSAIGTRLAAMADGARRRPRADHRGVDTVGPQRAAHPPPRLRLLGHHPLPDPGRQRRQRARPRRGDALQPARVELLASAEDKQLKGVTLGHFGAFFSRQGRENDYLWGRLDTAERLIVLLSTPPGRSVGWFRKTDQDDEPNTLRRQRCIGGLQDRRAASSSRPSGTR